MDDKEREELEELRQIVAGVDKVVKKYAKKYLKDAPRGRLHIESFFELLMLKARKIGRDKAFEDLVSDAVQDKITYLATSYIGKHVRDMVFLPILIRRAGLDSKKYRGYCLRGGVPKTPASLTIEIAYETIRTEALNHFSKTIADISNCKMDLMEEYDAAQYYKDDVVAGIRMIAKVSETEHKGDEN